MMEKLFAAFKMAVFAGVVAFAIFAMAVMRIAGRCSAEEKE